MLKDIDLDELNALLEDETIEEAPAPAIMGHGAEPPGRLWS
jgi:hypothetical protein